MWVEKSAQGEIHFFFFFVSVTNSSVECQVPRAFSTQPLRLSFRCIWSSWNSVTQVLQLDLLFSKRIMLFFLSHRRIGNTCAA